MTRSSVQALGLHAGPPLSLSAWLRYDVVRRLLPPAPQRLLEIGAGLGSVGARLAGRFDYVGLEPDPVSFATAERRVQPPGRMLNCTAEDLPPTEIFDVVCAFEVLEHMEDDAAALSRWLSRLRPGGWMLVSVPQGRHRYGPQDEWVGHYRRYDRSDLESLLDNAGLRELTTTSYGFPLGNALEWARDTIAGRRVASASSDERTAGSGRWLQPPDWAGAATQAATFPFRVAQRPFAGTSLGTGLVTRGRLLAADAQLR